MKTLMKKAASSMLVRVCLFIAAVALALGAYFFLKKSTMRTSLKGHTGNIMNAAYSPDGTRLTSGGGSAIRIWNVGGSL